jgi:hypothetical protein
LQEQNNEDILLKLADAVTKSDKDKGKKHQVFERSFECKQITSQHFFLQKLSYMHNNPSGGVWYLVNNPVDYIHSSARYYINGEQGIYLIEELLYTAVSCNGTRPGVETRQGSDVYTRKILVFQKMTYAK